MHRTQNIGMTFVTIAFATLPEPVLYRLLHFIQLRRPRTSLDTASDHRKIALQQGVELWIYWSDVPSVGSGPSASLFVLREEVLRLDCFGGREGHMHLNPDQQRFNARVAARLYFPEGSRAEHIDRAVFEIIANTDAALKSNRLARVRKFSINQYALSNAARQIRFIMPELLRRHGAVNSAKP